MLVLSRRVGEKLVIDGTIGVTVLAVNGKTVRLGVDAPALVTVDRSEVHERRGGSSPRGLPRLGASAPDEKSSRRTATPEDGKGRAVAFDLDAASQSDLQEALPGWVVEPVHGATAGSLAADWNPEVADLLVVRILDNVTTSLGLCRFLAFCNLSSAAGRWAGVGKLVPGARREDHAHGAPVPLLVLVPRGPQGLVEAALEAGAASCLMLPIHPKEVASALAHARAGNNPGRHTLNLDQAQRQDLWRDDGGQG